MDKNFEQGRLAVVLRCAELSAKSMAEKDPARLKEITEEIEEITKSLGITKEEAIIEATKYTTGI